MLATQLQKKPAAFRRRAPRRYIRGATPLGSYLESGTDLAGVQVAAFVKATEGKLPDLLRVIAQCRKWGSMDDPCEAGYSPSSRIDAQ
jgi:hypothetical protein